MATICFLSVALTGTLVPAEGVPGKIAFLAVSNNFWQAYVMDEDGKHLRQITRSPVDKVHVSWSSARDRLLVNTNLGRLLIVELASGREEQLDIGMEGMTDAVWSRDGTEVLFSLSIANSIDANDIWLVDIATGHRERLVGMKHLQHDPAWTYDEYGIVFLSGAGSQNHDLWVLDRKSRAVKQITVGRLYHFEPACSARDEIVFSSNRTGDYEIWVCDLDGTRFEQMTHSPGFDGQPCWSTDGGRMAFVSTRSGRSAVWLVGRDGKNLRQLTPVQMECRGPAWSR